MVEHLPSKFEALSSNSSTMKERKEERERERKTEGGRKGGRKKGREYNEIK
jgi:hypothetical protein